MMIGQNSKIWKAKLVTYFSGNYKSYGLYKWLWLNGSWPLRSLKDKCLTLLGFLEILCFLPIKCKIFNHVWDIKNMMLFTWIHLLRNRMQSHCIFYTAWKILLGYISGKGKNKVRRKKSREKQKGYIRIEVRKEKER